MRSRGLRLKLSSSRLALDRSDGLVEVAVEHNGCCHRVSAEDPDVEAEVIPSHVVGVECRVIRVMTLDGVIRGDDEGSGEVGSGSSIGDRRCCKHRVEEDRLEDGFRSSERGNIIDSVDEDNIDSLLGFAVGDECLVDGGVIIGKRRVVGGSGSNGDCRQEARKSKQVQLFHFFVFSFLVDRLYLTMRKAKDSFITEYTPIVKIKQ